jgi:toxin secretion/phage lysis holin
MKNMICTIAGAVGGIVATLFGGWTEGLLVLVILMGIDYISGLVVAGVFHSSPKSPNGALESKACLKGLVRKIFVLALVAVAHLIDRLIGTNYIRDAASIAFCLNEVISILENAGLMGIPIPKVLRKAIDVLRDKAGESNNESD